MSTQLTYRGTTYQSQAQTVKMIDSQQFAQYRGLHYTVRRPLNVSQSESKILKYRGIAYNTGNATVSNSQHNQVPTSMVPAFN
ncbi:MAG: DUF4278 domain-containing protein [Microcoleaceae cyanobacterium]